MMDSLERRVALRFREYRNQKGLSQSQLARRVGCSTELVSRIERGRCLPSVKSLVSFARALAVSPNDLLDFDAAGGVLADGNSGGGIREAQVTVPASDAPPS